MSQVYDRNTGRDEIVLDVEIIYEGDASANFTLEAGTVNRGVSNAIHTEKTVVNFAEYTI